MILVREVNNYLENWASLSYQESYDNAGLLVGNPNQVVTGILVALDCTEEIIMEAVEKGCNMVIAHHPIVFKGLKKITGKNYVERAVIIAIKNDVALYASHTNLDHVTPGVNHKIAEKLGLQSVKILSPKKQLLMKLVTFVPINHTQKVLDAIYEAGAGQIGEYKNCSFQVGGTGTFTPTGKANPSIGELYKTEKVNENRIEVILPAHLESGVLQALRLAHPYEEVAYYLTALSNENQEVGAGVIGELPEALGESEWLAYLKNRMEVSVIRHTRLLGKPIQKVAVCGGAGGFLLGDAIRKGADVFVTADYKYHEFFDADGQIIICDIGHYESEVFTKELIHNRLSEKFTNFAVLNSELITNPVGYYF